MAVNIGSGGVFDLTNCPVMIPSTDIIRNEGGAYRDPEGRNTPPYNILLARTELQDPNMDVGTNRTITVT